MYRLFPWCNRISSILRTSRLILLPMMRQQIDQHNLLVGASQTYGGLQSQSHRLSHLKPAGGLMYRNTTSKYFSLKSTCCLLRIFGRQNMINYYSKSSFSSATANDPKEGFAEASNSLERRQQKAENITRNVFDELTQESSGKLDTEQTADIAGFLLTEKVPPWDIKNAFVKLPKILTEPRSHWELAVTGLKELGFEPSQYMQAIVDFPELFRGRVEVLSRCFDTLRALGYRDRQLHKILLKNPSIVDISSKSLVNRHQKLLTIFPRSDLARMVLSDASLLTTPFSETEAKVCYVCDVMKSDLKSALKTNFVEYDLLHIETRHQFLFRAGMYETPNKHGITKHIQNPTLKNIVDTDDRYFAVKVAGLTKAEYLAFQRLYALEKERSGDTQLHSDSSSDSDSEDD